ncbi:hypothetical protein [Verrucomicrobium spinosum]|uniref:hypothetical protein n=2 Tax=Verrucomicrobium spinosum TaxID=2736 RepID=UPI0012F62A1E|nr:hypothetical protein [Verrucomicrobium spinosum]
MGKRSSWSRRRVLAAGASGSVAGWLAPRAHGAEIAPGAKAPFKLLYNSDTTHILTCTSSWRPNKEPLADFMFEKTVDEAVDAGADAFLIAPGLGWVPWWPSQVLPLAEHCEWFKRRFNLPKASTSFTSYVLRGGDFLKLTVDRCHARGAACLVSFRLNDVHHKESADAPGNSHIASVPQFYSDHPQYRLGEQSRETQISWARHVQNWTIPEVREFKFRFIEELSRNYDLDGIELDFYRAAAYFRAGETTREQRRQIMTEFMGRVRRTLDDHARAGRRRWLSVRIPGQLSAHDAQGIDVQAFAAAGVDMFNLSASYHVEQTTSLPEIRRLVPGAAIYLELTHVVSFNGDTRNRSHRRTTTEIATTTAHLAYSRGADGLSLFNFQYYRDYRDPGQTAGDGPYTEPPFELLQVLRRPEAMASLPQHYFVGLMYRNDPRRAYPFPRRVKGGESLRYVLDLAPPAQGWRREGKMRLQARSSCPEGGIWQARINGQLLPATPDVGEPYPTVYTQMHGQAGEWLAWNVPVSALRPGLNEVVITCPPDTALELLGLDLSLP